MADALFFVFGGEYEGLGFWLVLAIVTGVLWAAGDYWFYRRKSQLPAETDSGPSLPDEGSPSKAAPSPNWTPIWRVIAHVAEALGDVDEDQDFSEARAAVRRAALNGTLTLRGRRKLVDDRDPRDNKAYAPEAIDIPKEVWETTELNAFSSSEPYVDEPTASPEWVGEDQIGMTYYKQVHADMVQVKALWPLKDGPRRVSLFSLKDDIEKAGWDIGEKSMTLDVIDILEGMRQAGLDGDIQFWGRPRNYSADSLNKREPLVVLTQSHWITHEIDMGNFQAAESSADVRTYGRSQPDPNMGSYIDLHVDPKAAMRWLKNDAEAYRGFTERRRS